MGEKRKVGTVLDETLVREAKATAAMEGIPLSALLEKALRSYLQGRHEPVSGTIARSSYGAMKVDREVLSQIMEEEPGALEA